MLKREILEETSLTVKDIICLCDTFDYKSKSGVQTRQFNFVVSVENHDILKLDPKEHDLFEWIQFRAELLRTQKQKKENQFFSSRVVSILEKQRELPEIPSNLLRIVGEEYKTLAEDADPSEIETLWRVNKKSPELPFSDILKNYLKDKSLTNYHLREFIFSDDELQRAIFEQIKIHPKFEEFMKDSPRLRIRMRETIPELFVDFFPESQEADTRELKYIIDDSRFIRFGHLFNARQPSEQNANRFFAKARETLRNANLEMYEQVAGSLNDYELVKRYDSLYLQLSGK